MVSRLFRNMHDFQERAGTISAIIAHLSDRMLEAGQLNQGQHQRKEQ
jgi:hypothetical protein